MSELMLTQEAGTMFHLKLTPVPRGAAPTADKLFLVPSLRLGTPLKRLCLEKVCSWALALQSGYGPHIFMGGGVRSSSRLP
jgi:hypothetical protein